MDIVGLEEKLRRRVLCHPVAKSDGLRAGGRASGHRFDLEYQEGSRENHYRRTDEAIDLETVSKVLQLYLEGDENWRSHVEREHCPL